MSFRRRYELGVAAFAGVVAITSGAALGAERYVLTYVAPGGCPNEAELRADVAARVTDGVAAAGARIDLRVRSEGAHFVGELIATDQAGSRGRRELQGKTCAEVAHALAFLAGLAIELGGRLESERDATPAQGPPAPGAAAATATLSRRPLAFATVAAGGVRGGVSNGLRPAGEIGLEFEPAGTGIWLPAVRAGVVMGNGLVTGADWRMGFLLVSGRASMCPLRFGTAHFDVRPCMAGELGVVSAGARTASDASQQDNLWAAAELGAHLRWWATPVFFLEIEAGAMFPLRRPSYFIPPAQIVYSVPRVTARTVLAAGLGF